MAGCGAWQVAPGALPGSAQNLLNSGNNFEAAVDDAAAGNVTVWFLARAANEIYYVNDGTLKEEKP
jgi:hypothetical protein